MAYHVYKLLIKNLADGGSNILLGFLKENNLIIGTKFDPVLEEVSGQASFYVKVRNTKRFEQYFNKRKYDESDPVNIYLVGKPVWFGYFYESERSKKTKDKEYEKVKDFLKRHKR